jgi:membrane-bound metal-dependent hydrolase YbcI (DUF457 family)
VTSREHVPIGIALAAAAAPLTGASSWTVLLGGALIVLSDGRRPLVTLILFSALALIGGVWPGVLLLYVVSAMIGAIAPDLDHPGSRVSRALPPLRWAYVLAFLNPMVWLVVGWKRMQRLGGHRQVSHSLFAIPAAMLLAATATWLAARLPPVALLDAWLMRRPPDWLAGYPADWAATAMVALGTGAGYLSHELADACTAAGWRPLAPWSDRKVYLLPALLRIRTPGGRS